MNKKDLKKILAGIGIAGLISGSAMTVTGCATHEKGAAVKTSCSGKTETSCSGKTKTSYAAHTKTSCSAGTKSSCSAGEK